jgi:hypothetical protein
MLIRGLCPYVLAMVTLGQYDRHTRLVFKIQVWNNLTRPISRSNTVNYQHVQAHMESKKNRCQIEAWIQEA